MTHHRAIVWKHNVSHKNRMYITYGNATRDAPAATVYVYKKLVKFGLWFLRYARWQTGQTDRQTNTLILIALLCTVAGGEVVTQVSQKMMTLNLLDNKMAFWRVAIQYYKHIKGTFTPNAVPRYQIRYERTSTKRHSCWRRFRILSRPNAFVSIPSQIYFIPSLSLGEKVRKKHRKLYISFVDSCEMLFTSYLCKCILAIFLWLWIYFNFFHCQRYASEVYSVIWPGLCN